MDHWLFIWKIDEKRVLAAIKAAEARTSGELRVFISSKAAIDPLAAAEKAFLDLGMDKTRERNGVLIFIAPKSRNFAIVGDEGVHVRCAPSFWEDVSAAIGEKLRSGSYTESIILGIERASTLLAEHFPMSGQDKNELPDSLAGD
ncbi:MAG: TPM domain-containing protein [Verrucomicrobiales bacterium]